MFKVHKQIFVFLALFAAAAMLFAGGSREFIDEGHSTGAMEESNPAPQLTQVDGIPVTQLPDSFEYPVQYSDSQWLNMLGRDSFIVMREQGTESPFNNQYNSTYEAGTYYSKATGQALFSSESKYNSHTGWPSFYEPINEDAVHLFPDFELRRPRMEVVDSLSGSHLGHVFADGPDPTGLRYCINSASLIFVPEGQPLPADLLEIQRQHQIALD